METAGCENPLLTSCDADSRKTAQVNMETVIELRNLSVSLGGRPILKDLNAQVRGRAIGLLGPNGAGKTTLIHTLLGFYPPTEGSALILGKDVALASKEVRALNGYMPERDSFIEIGRAHV